MVNKVNIAPPHIQIVSNGNLDRRTARAISHTFTRIAPNLYLLIKLNLHIPVN